MEETRRDENGSGSRVGRRLRAAREAKKKSIEEASHESGVPLRYLRMLEEGRFPAVADPAYLTHFLRRYASYLALDVDEVTREFLAQTEPDTTARRTGKKPPEAVWPTVRVRSAKQRSRSLAVRSSLVVVLALAGGAIAFAVVRVRIAWPPSSIGSSPREVAGTAPVVNPEIRHPTRVPREQPTPIAEPTPVSAASPEITRAPDSVTPDLPAGEVEEPPEPQAAVVAAAPVSEEAPAASPAAVAPAAPANPRPPSSVATESKEIVEQVHPESREVRFFPPYELEITATSRQVWVWISIDGGPRQAVSLRQGETARWVAQRGYALSVDDAGGVRVSLNREELPRLGAPGRARRNLVIPSRDMVPTTGSPVREGIAG